MGVSRRENKSNEGDSRTEEHITVKQRLADTVLGYQAPRGRVRKKTFQNITMTPICVISFIVLYEDATPLVKIYT